MYLVRLYSLLALCAAALLSVACGQDSTLLSPTAPTDVSAAVAMTDGGAFDVSAPSSAGEFGALARGGNGKGKGKGHEGDDDESQEGENDDTDEGEEDEGEEDEGDGEAGEGDDEDEEDGEGEHHTHKVSGFVTAVTATSLAVRDLTVTVDGNTVIRHGHRILSITDIRVGDHVQARGTLDGTTLLATEIKVEDTGNDNDDGEDEEDGENEEDEEVKVDGTVSGLSGTCPALTFIVGTTTVTTTATTEFDDVTCATLANGASVEVKGTRQADGSIVGAKVELEMDEVEGTASIEPSTRRSTYRSPIQEPTLAR